MYNVLQRSDNVTFCSKNR